MSKNEHLDGLKHLALVSELEARQTQLELQRKTHLELLEEQGHSRRVKHLNPHGLHHHLHYSECISQTNALQPRAKAGEVPYYPSEPYGITDRLVLAGVATA